MAKRYHINPHTYRVGECRLTTGVCGFAGDSGKEPPHWDTKEEAQEALDKKMEDFAIPGSLKKKVPAKKVLTQDVYEKLVKEQRKIISRIGVASREQRDAEDKTNKLNQDFKNGDISKENFDVQIGEEQEKYDMYKKMKNELSDELSDFQDEHNKSMIDFDKKLQKDKNLKDRLAEQEVQDVQAAADALAERAAQVESDRKQVEKDRKDAEKAREKAARERTEAARLLGQQSSSSSCGGSSRPTARC